MKIGAMLKSITNFMMTVIIIVLIIIAFTIVSAKVKGQDPSFLGYQIKAVLSGSMEPEIQTGSIIIIEQTHEDLLKVGDVVTFLTKENILVTHRIVEKEENTYITKGDNNNGNDVEPVLSQNIIGKYTGITIPYIGYIMVFANSKLGSALLLILPGIYLIGCSFVMIWRSFKQIKNPSKMTTHSD